MPFPNPTACNVPLDQIAGTGFNTVAVPDQQGAEYKSITEQLLYEIWQTNLLIIAGLTPPGMVIPILFTIGDGQAGTPVSGTSQIHSAALQGQSLVDKTLLVIREGIALRYSSPVTINDIKRFNSGGLGGFTFEPASGLVFNAGEEYMIFVLGINTNAAP